MKIICTSLNCSEENPVKYCKKCSHANWIVRGKTTFNPHFGFSSDYYYKYYDQWLKEFEGFDIEKASFE